MNICHDTNRPSELKEKLAPCHGRSGVFWMCFEDFARYFSIVWACKARPHWCQASRQGALPFDAAATEWPAFSIKTFAPTNIEISVCQAGQQGRTRRSQHHTPVGMGVVIAESPAVAQGTSTNGANSGSGKASALVVVDASTSDVGDCASVESVLGGSPPLTADDGARDKEYLVLPIGKPPCPRLLYKLDNIALLWPVDQPV
eukprot:m.74159 g.74159  ORF g.74159 m.74159 type:complete len:202 (-) comp16153_c0_seq1:814-1419(-)